MIMMIMMIKLKLRKVALTQVASRNTSMRRARAQILTIECYPFELSQIDSGSRFERSNLCAKVFMYKACLHCNAMHAHT